MSKNFFLTTTLVLLSLLQTSPSSWAARAEKNPSQAKKNLSSKEDNYNFSVYMHGPWTLKVSYIDCDGNKKDELVLLNRSINRCAKVGTDVSAVDNDLLNPDPLPLHKDNGEASTDYIQVPPKNKDNIGGIKMNCGGWTGYDRKCDWSTPYEMQ